MRRDRGRWVTKALWLRGKRVRWGADLPDNTVYSQGNDYDARATLQTMNSTSSLTETPAPSVLASGSRAIRQGVGAWRDRLDLFSERWPMTRVRCSQP